MERTTNTLTTLRMGISLKNTCQSIYKVNHFMNRLSEATKKILNEDSIILMKERKKASKSMRLLTSFLN